MSFSTACWRAAARRDHGRWRAAGRADEAGGGRALEGELTDHLGCEKHAREGHNSGNSRNGRTRKRVKTDTSELEIEVPRDRDSTFEPEFVRKGQRRLPGFDEKVIALYARGMTTRGIQGHMKELYKV